MLHLSFSALLLYSAFQLPVNEAPTLIDPGFDLEHELDLDAFETSLEVGIAAPFFLLLSVWLLAYRKLQKDTGSFITCPASSASHSSSSPLTSESASAPGAESTDHAAHHAESSTMAAPPKAAQPHSPPAKAAPKCPPRAKAKGKALAKGPKGPGPPPKKAAPAKAAAKAESTPVGDQTKVNPFGARRVRWRTLNSAEGTVFHGLGAGHLRSDTAKMLNEVFTVVHGSSGRSSFVPKSAGVCLLDRNRAQQLAIVFRRSPVPLQKLCSALLTLDFSLPLGDEELEGLIQAWPTKADFEEVAKYTGPTEHLRDVEQCIKQMAQVPRSEARLRLLRLSRSLDGLDRLLEQFVLLRSACEELLNSETLKRLLDEALIMGNYINGDAGCGFSLDAFSQLKSLKGAANTTALHCLCASCAQDDPDFCSKLVTELGTLRSASQISLGSLNEVLQRLRGEVQSASEEFAYHSTEYQSTPALALEEVPLAPIQPLGSKLGLPCTIPPLHLQMLQAEPLAVTYEHSGEETASSRVEGNEAETPHAALRSSRTPRVSGPSGRRARSATSPGPTELTGLTLSKSPIASPRPLHRAVSRSPELAPQRQVANGRVAMPPLRLSAIDPKEIRANGLCTPRNPHGSMIREAPPLRSARGEAPSARGEAPDDMPRDGPPVPVGGRPTVPAGREEEAWRLYLQGLPAVTPRCSPLLTARHETHGLSHLAACTPRSSMSARGATGVPPPTEPQAVSVFIRNVTQPSPDEKCQNRTERFQCPQKTSNGTCGIPSPLWSELGCNGTAPLEGPVSNGSREDDVASPSSTSSQTLGGARSQLHALVARGRILLKQTTQEVAEMTCALQRCERFFGGLSMDSKDGGVRLLCAAVELVTSFQQAWDEVHRDDRWVGTPAPGPTARFLPLSSVRTSARSEVSTARRRKFTPRRSFP
ncbi:Formin-like protein 20 (AtFH20) [Durusdinium trenchii]|uniref:Formin-like protein 20 (AtFH20) n=1 Tax=Durusdinium trenchii TaxID=1381693 RepID=A0ABP0JGY1_9DINO